MRARSLAVPAITVGAIVAVAPQVLLGALKAAAGGGPNGQNGFTQFADFLSTIGTYLVYVGAAAGVIGLVASGGMLMTGSPQANGLLGKVVLGLGIILLAKAIFA
jgi:hypothetical protein